MQSHVIESWDDPLLEPFRNLKDKELEKKGGRFIAEGQNIVLRLLRSNFEIESVLISPRREQAIAPFAVERARLLIASDDLIERVIGFEFHSGVLACGISPKSPKLENVIPPPPQPMLIVVGQEITNPENLGSLIRASAAFGVDAMLLGERCCNPFFRQSVRVSMGSVFSLPIVCSTDLQKDLDVLKRLDCETWATVLAEDAIPLRQTRRSGRAAVVFGNEAQGLDAATIAKCDKRLTIPMQRGTDSLNVTVAAAVVLYQFSNS